MRSTSAGRWSGAPRSLLPGPVDSKKNPRPDATTASSAVQSSTLPRPSSAQKLRPGSRLNVMDSTPARPTTPTNVRPTTPTNVRPTTPTSIRPTTPTSTSRSLSASKTRPAVHQLFTVASPALQGPVPIDQRSKFTVSKSVAPPGKDVQSPNGAGTPSRSRTPTKAPSSAGASREVKVGPYGFMLRELKREKNMFVKDDTKERDLKTLMNQLTLFKLQLKRKFETDRVQEERLLLQSWQLVYDAEEEAFGLRSKEKIALEINKIHAQLVDMDNRVDQVNNFIAPVFEKLNAYVNLRMHQSEEERNATLVRSITAKATINREYTAAFLKLDKSIRVLERMMEKRDRLTGPVKTPETKRSSSFTFDMPVLTPVTEDKKIKKTISSNTFEVPALVHVENFVDDSVAMPGTIKESSKPSRRPSRENMGTSVGKVGLKTGSSSSTGSPVVATATAPTAPVLSTPSRSSVGSNNGEESPVSGGHSLTPKGSSENLKKGFMRPTQSTTHHVEENREAHHQTLTPKGSLENVKKDVSPKTSKDNVLPKSSSSNDLKKELSPKQSMDNVKKDLTPKMSMENLKKGGLTPKPSMENLSVKKDTSGISPKGVDSNKSFRRINSNGSLTGIQRPSSANSLTRKSNSNPTLVSKKSSTPVTPSNNSKVNLDLSDIQMVDDVNMDDDEEINSIPAVVMPPKEVVSATKERPRSANSVSYTRATPETAPAVSEGRHSINLTEISNLKGLSSGGGFDDFASKLASLESGFYQIPEFKPKTKRSKSIDRSTTPTSGSSTPSILKNVENKTSLSNGAAISDLTTPNEDSAAAATVSKPTVKAISVTSLSVDSTADLIPLNNSSNNSPSRSTPSSVEPLPSPKKSSVPASEAFPVTENVDLAAKIAALESKTAVAPAAPSEAPVVAKPAEQQAPVQSSVQRSYADFLAKNKPNNTSNPSMESVATPAVTVTVEKPAVAVDFPVVSEVVVPPVVTSDVPQSNVKKSYTDFLAKNKSSGSTLTIDTSSPASSSPVPPSVVAVEEKPVEVVPPVVAPVASVTAAAAPSPAAPAVSSGNAYSNFLKKFKSEKASPVTVVETTTTKTEEPVAIVAAPAVAPAAVVAPEPSPVSPNPGLASLSVDSSAPTPPRNSYASFLQKTKPQSSLSINTNSNAVSSESIVVESQAPTATVAAPVSSAPAAAPSEIVTPSRNAYAEFMAKKNSSIVGVAAPTPTATVESSSNFLDSLPPPAARPPVPHAASTSVVPPAAPAVPTVAAPSPAKNSAYGAFLSKNKANSTSFYSKSETPAVASSSAYIDVPATSVSSAVVVDDEPPPSVYTAHRMSLKRQEQVPDVVRDDIVKASASSDKLSILVGSENQPVAPAAQPSKNAYSDFLKKRPSITAPSATTTAHLDDSNIDSIPVVPSPKSPASEVSLSAKTPSAAATPVAAASPTPAAPAAPTSAYAAFLKRNSGGNPGAQVSYTAVAATEEPVADIATIRAASDAAAAAASSSTNAPTQQQDSSKLTIEVSEKPPRPMSTRTAYSDFLKKKSTLPNESTATDDDSGAGGGGAAAPPSTSASPASVSSTSSAPAATTTGESTSNKMSYQDFIRKKSDPMSPKKPSVDYGATVSTYEETNEPTATYGEILAKFKKTETEELKPNSPSSKNNKSSPKSASAASVDVVPAVSLPAPAVVSEVPVTPQQPQQPQPLSVFSTDSNDDHPPVIMQTVSQDYYGSKGNSPEVKSGTNPETPVTPAVAVVDDFEPREGIQNYDSFDEHDQQFNKPIDWDTKASATSSGREKSNSVDGLGRVQGLPPLQPSASKPKGLARFMSFSLSSPSPKKPPSDSGSVDGQLMSPSQGSSQGSVDEAGEPKKKKKNPIHFLQKNVFGRQKSSPGI